MPVYSVTFTATVFRTNGDGTQMKVERLLLNDTVVAKDKQLAIAVVARRVSKDHDDELLANSNVTVTDV